MNAIIKNLIDNNKFQDYLKNIKEKISPINLLGLTDMDKILGEIVNKEENTIYTSYKGRSKKTSLSYNI